MSNDIPLAKFPALQPALDEAANTGQSLYVSPGRYPVREECHASKNIRIFGDTSAGNQLVFEDGASLVYRGTGACGDIPDTEASGQYHTTELRFERVSICVTGNTDRVIDAQWSNSGNSGTLAPTLTTRDFRIFAAPKVGTVPGSWQKAIYLAGASNISIERTHILGGRTATLQCGPALFVDGSTQAAVEIFARQLHIAYCQIGAQFVGHVEGINIDSSTILECDYDVIADATSNPGAWPMLNIHHSHMSARQVGIVTTGMTQLGITNNWFYGLQPNYIAGIINSQDVGPCVLNSRFTDNTVISLGGGGYGLIVNHAAGGKESLDVGGVNVFQNFGTALQLNAGVDGVNVHPTTRFVDCQHNHN